LVKTSIFDRNFDFLFNFFFDFQPKIPSFNLNFSNSLCNPVHIANAKIERRAQRIQQIRRIIICLMLPCLALPFYWISQIDINSTSHIKTALQRLRRTPETLEFKTPAGVLPNFSGEYMIRYYYTDPTYFTQWTYDDVTLATQCSANHLHHVG